MLFFLFLLRFHLILERNRKLSVQISILSNIDLEHNKKIQSFEIAKYHDKIIIEIFLKKINKERCW